ncbi:MAG: cbb3-type cytochrome oxidase assembly protein CcoS [Lysobacterales bacterium]
MNSLLFLVPLSIALLGVAIGAFIWAVRRGQFDDLDTAALDILVDDEPEPAADAEPVADPASREPDGA